MELFDFDKNLNDYAQRWYDAHAEGMTPDEMEDAVDGIYLAWTAETIGELDASPKAYFAALDDDALIGQFLGYYAKKSIPSVLTDEMCERPRLAARIAGLLRESTDGELIETCMQLLEELGSKDVYPLYLDWILDPATDDDLALHASEILQEDANAVLGELLAAIPTAEGKIRDRISDLIVYAKPCEAGFHLLAERLGAGRDLPLYACYLGMYGDPRAIELLKAKAVDCDYVAFMEITNAVERLGGDMDIERDFSEDPAYVRIKSGGKYGNRQTGHGQKK